MMRLVLVAMLTLTASDVHAFVPYMSGDKELHWPESTKTIALTLVQQDSPLALSEFQRVVDSAFAQWSSVGSAVPAARVSAMNDTPAEDDHQVQFLGADWPFDPNALAVTVFSYKKSSGEMVDADIYINATGPCLGDAALDEECYDLQAVLTHEAGHFMGLDHNEDIVETVMYPSAQQGNIAKRALQDDDRAGVISTYGGTMNDAEGSPSTPIAAGSVSNTSNPTPDVARQGCNAGAGPMAWWLLFGVMCLRVSRVAKLAVVAMPLLASTAFASSVSRESLSAQMDRSDAVFVGHAVAKRSYFDVALGFIVTEHTLAVDECVRGSCASAVTFRTLGGEVGDMVTRVSGETEPQQDEPSLFVASKRRAGNAVVFESTAFGQGVLKLDAKLGVYRSKITWLRLDEVRK